MIASNSILANKLKVGDWHQTGGIARLVADIAEGPRAKGARRIRIGYMDGKYLYVDQFEKVSILKAVVR